MIGSDSDEGWGPVTSVAIHPQGELLVAGYHSGHVCQFDLLSGLLEWEVQPHNASVGAIAYDKGNTATPRILTGADDNHARCKVSGNSLAQLAGIGYLRMTAIHMNFLAVYLIIIEIGHLVSIHIYMHSILL